MKERSAVRLACLLLASFFVHPTAQSQSCPCWTAEDLTAIIVDTCGCENNLDLTSLSLSCVGINAAPGFDCQVLTTLGQGYAGVVRDGEFDTYLCEWAYPPQPNPVEVMFVTQEEALACSDLLAAYGEIAQPQSFECSIDAAPCTTDADCTSPLGFCSLDGQACTGDTDCPPAGNCSADAAVCRTDDDCPGFLNFCQNLQPQSCDFQTNSCDMKLDCLDECFPPGCRILPTEGPSDLVEIAFTSQSFDVASGDLAELRADGDFLRANCQPAVSGVFADAFPLLPGEGVYFLTRAVVGVSCTDHGQSSLTPDPRGDLDGTCP